MYKEIDLSLVQERLSPAKGAVDKIEKSIIDGPGLGLTPFNAFQRFIRDFTGAAMDVANRMLLQVSAQELPFYQNVEMSATENPSSLRLRFENLAESFLRTANGWNAFVVDTGSQSQADAIAEYMSGGNGPLGLIAIEKKLIWLYEAKYKPHVPTPMEVGEPAWVKRLEKKLDYIILKIDAE